MALRRARREHHKHAPGTSQATLRPSVNNEVLHPICPKRLAPAPRLRGLRGCDHGPHRAQQHLRRERRPQHARTHRRPGQGLNPRAVRLQWPPTARQHGTERQYRRPRTAIFNGPQTGKYSWDVWTIQSDLHSRLKFPRGRPSMVGRKSMSRFCPIERDCPELVSA